MIDEKATKCVNINSIDNEHGGKKMLKTNEMESQIFL